MIQFFDQIKVSDKDLELVSSDLAQGRECGSFHFHGFEGIEVRVAKKITDWISNTER